jgi:hypothetical protein
MGTPALDAVRSLVEVRDMTQSSGDWDRVPSPVDRMAFRFRSYPGMPADWGGDEFRRRRAAMQTVYSTTGRYLPQYPEELAAQAFGRQFVLPFSHDVTTSLMRAARAESSCASAVRPDCSQTLARPSSVSATKTWSGPKAFSRIAKARRYSASASAARPVCSQTLARPSSGSATRAWSGPNAFSRIASARR